MKYKQNYKKKWTWQNRNNKNWDYDLFYTGKVLSRISIGEV